MVPRKFRITPCFSPISEGRNLCCCRIDYILAWLQAREPFHFTTKRRRGQAHDQHTIATIYSSKPISANHPRSRGVHQTGRLHNLPCWRSLQQDKQRNGTGQNFAPCEKRGNGEKGGGAMRKIIKSAGRALQKCSACAIMALLRGTWLPERRNP